MTTALEICVEDPAGARAALAGGADRVELCAALSLGGVAPSPGLALAVLAEGLPVNVLLRPVTGGFVHDPALVEAVTRDIAAYAALGVHGVVVGALTDRGALDLDALGRWRDAARDIAMTLHRAVDLTPSPARAAALAADLGIDRVLTSGGADTAARGVDTIRAMVEAAGDRIAIMAGSGVDAANVADLVARSGARAVHASARVGRGWTDPRIAAFGFGGDCARFTDVERVRALRAALDLADGGTA